MGTESIAPATPEQEAANAEAFAEAEANCPDGHTVCATLAEDGRPLYFHAPVNTTVDNMRELAFRCRNGRDMSSYEKAVLAEAKREQHLA